jgi:hypothetical protein
LAGKSIKYIAGAVAVVALAVVGFVVFRGTGSAPFFDGGRIEAFEPRLSRIATPVTIPLEQLRQLADQRLSSEIYRENSEIAPGITLDVVITRRNEPVEMDMVGGWLMSRVPITVAGTPNIRLGPLRLSGGAVGFEADLDVELRTRPRINPDWSINPETTADIDVGRVDLTVAGRTVDATAIVSEILDRNVDRITEPLDDYLRSLDVRSMMEPIWLQFGEPIRVNDDPSVWLRIRPQRFSFSAPDVQADNIRFEIGMDAYLDSVVGERPPAVELGPIPDLEETSIDLGSVNVILPVVLEIDETNRVLSERITGREDRIGGDAVVRWKEVTLSGTGNRLRISVEFEADTGLPIIRSLDGVMILEGRPTFDPDSQTLTMKNVDYELVSDSALAGIADLLMHEELRILIQELLVLPMGEVIESLRLDLQSEMESISFGDFGTAEASIQILEPRLQNVTEEAIELAVVAGGTLRIGLDLGSVLSPR